MLGFICFFFPAVISVCVFEVLSRRNLRFKNLLYRFCANAIVINFICLLIKRFVLGTIGEPLVVSGDMPPSIALNYIVMAVPISVILVLAEIFLSKKVKFTVKEDENADEEKAQD